ncbi:DUF6678 family protein [Paraburkholderia sediminicola]|uniref:DUF6678 family protein n=1 Tax=Paraburkholderia sediminicola TaxID=458836 RepID=UPI0038BBE6A3
MTPVMNNTKWGEIRIGMHALEGQSPRFRVRNLQSGYVSAWDREWFYHFFEHHEEDEWVEVEVTSPSQREAVLGVLRSVHVPGVETKNGFKIFSYVAEGTEVDYL